jgi:ComF family protein
MIHAYKYNSIRALGQELAGIICERLKNNLPNGEKIVIPIPLHFRKERERGFNQALFLAQIISQKLNLPLEKNILVRKKNTKAQIELKKRERIKNLHLAFVCSLPKKVRGKTILLIDDVTTTGTTLNEAARVLRRSGARQVWGVTIAQG